MPSTKEITDLGYYMRILDAHAVRDTCPVALLLLLLVVYAVGNEQWVTQAYQRFRVMPA